MTFDEILDGLGGARENGSVALAQAAEYLDKTLRATGADVTLHTFTCRPYSGRVAGVVCLTLALAYSALMWRRRWGWALGLALLLPTYLLLDYEGRLPLFSRLGELPEANVVASFPVTDPERTVILSAHYDTKTDLLDHYQRAPIQFLIVPMAMLAVAFPLTGRWRRWRGRAEGHVRGWSVIVPLYFAGFALAMSGGALVAERSPGALDDGAAVATLVKLAESLAAGEPQLARTEVMIVLFAGEEVNLQGSAAFVRERLPLLPPRPLYVINGELWGGGRVLSYFTADRSPLRRYEAATALVRVLDRAARRGNHGGGIEPDVQPVTTDARSFMAAGIPSVTLASHREGESYVRQLHSRADTRQRLQPGALDRMLAFLKAALAEIEANGVPSL
ncbi:MAG: M28 family peptidase [Deltaproteobacteria bacterium]|nr:M28 family peptidase [Deltaproteobacteria bacterium]